MLCPGFKTDVSPKGTHIISGEWDKRKTEKSLPFDGRVEQKFKKPTAVRIENILLYKSMEEHFKNDIPWRETDLYDWFLSNQAKLPTNSNYRKDKIDKRLSKIDRLYHQIKTRGYKTQRQLLRTDDTILKERSLPVPEYDEVLVNIGRTGEIFLEDGRHRFMIAKLLDIDIPARVLVRHNEWQEKRQDICKSKTAKYETDFSSHPDLRRF
jgi:hypothetical protein